MSYSVCKPALYLKYLVRFVACHVTPPLPSLPLPTPPHPRPSSTVLYHTHAMHVPHTCTHIHSPIPTPTLAPTLTHNTHIHIPPPSTPIPHHHALNCTHAPTNQASVTDATLKIPHRLHNTIIGPKGKLLRSVMSECGGVRIHFPPSDSKSDEVRLHGPKDDVEKAKALLKDLADNQVLAS